MTKSPAVLMFASQKGGAGKTTLATHVAVYADRLGERVVLIDLDPQGTTTNWWEKRQADTPARSPASYDTLAAKAEALAADGFSLIVVDTPPAASRQIGKALAVADLIVMPVKPSPNDLHAVGATIDLAHRAGRPYVLVLNEAKPHAAITAQAAAALSEHGTVAPAIIGDRVGFPTAMIDGLTLAELEPRNPGAVEIAKLTKWLISRVRPSKTKRKEIV